jgi:hypothetical protein
MIHDWFDLTKINSKFFFDSLNKSDFLRDLCKSVLFIVFSGLPSFSFVVFSLFRVDGDGNDTFSRFVAWGINYKSILF